MNILICAGGTGGHIYPAVALGEKLIEKNSINQCFYIGSNTRMEKDVIPSLGYAFTGMDVDNFKKGLLGKINSFYKMFCAFLKCRALIKEKKIDVVIGFGNYISLPVVLAGKSLGIKTMIHEQNALPGKANLLLSKWVDVVVGSYPKNLTFFPNDKTVILGNPRAQLAYERDLNKDFFETYALDANLKTVVIFMGSLGSSTMNQLWIEALRHHDAAYQILYAAGSGHYESANDALKDVARVKVVEQVDGIGALQHAEIAITRSGATTLAEIAALKVPSILIPSPYVPDNGQEINAQALVDEEACIMLKEKELDATMLYQSMDRLMNDEIKRNKMKENLGQFGYIHSSEDIILKIEQIVGK